MPPPDDGICPVCRKAPVIDGFFGECRDCLAPPGRHRVRARVCPAGVRPEFYVGGVGYTTDFGGRGDERDDPDAC